MSYKLMFDSKLDVTEALKDMLGSPKVSVARDRRIAVKGTDMDQAAAEQVLADYLADKANIDADRLLDKKLEQIVEEAMDFGRSIIKRYGAKNIKAGKTDEEIDEIIDDLSSIISALVSGSLKSAKRKAQAFTPTAAVPQADVDWFVAEIDKYLGV